MAEILVRAFSNVNPDPLRDRRGAWKRGMPVVIMPDGHEWGLEERLPRFVIIKVPLVSVSRVEKYVLPQYEVLDPTQVYRRRRWIIRWEDLPLAARNALRDRGELIIKAHPDFTGAFDFTWTQVKSFFLNQETGMNEDEDL